MFKGSASNGTALSALFGKNEGEKPGEMSELECEKTTPFLPGISSQFFGRCKRRQLEATRIERDKLWAQSITDLGNLFDDVLPVERLEAASSLGPKKRRRRIFPQVIVF